LRRNSRLATSQLLNITCVQLNDWAGIITWFCSVLLVSFRSSPWLPLMLGPCGCKGAVQGSAGKTTYLVLPNIVQSSKSAQEYPVLVAVESCMGLGKTLSSSDYQICLVA